MTLQRVDSRVGDMMPAARHTALSKAPDLGQFVRLLLQKSIAYVCGIAGAGTEPTQRQRCRHALESLWPRRQALIRLLRRPPQVQQMDRHTSDGSLRLSPLDNATLGLHLAASRAARALLDQAGAEWRDLEQATHAEGAACPPWPPTPGLYAQAVRSAIEHATDDSELRLTLMELAITIVVTEYVALCRAHSSSRPAHEGLIQRGHSENLQAA